MSDYLGTFEIFHFWILTFILISVVVAALSIFTFKNTLSRFGLLKSNRREFYECGFKPVTQKPILISVQFIFICFFFLIYDIELTFSFPLVSNMSSASLLEVFIYSFIYLTFLMSLMIDFSLSMTDWRV